MRARGGEEGLRLLTHHRADGHEEVEAGELVDEVEEAVVDFLAGLFGDVDEAETGATAFGYCALRDLLFVCRGELLAVHGVDGVDALLEGGDFLGSDEIARDDGVGLVAMADDDYSSAYFVGVVGDAVSVAAYVLHRLDHDVEDLALHGALLGVAQEVLLGHYGEIARYFACDAADVDEVDLFCRQFLIEFVRVFEETVAGEGVFHSLRGVIRVRDL